MDDRWPIHEAKQRFGALVRAAEAKGPQFVIRHGEEIAVVMSVAEYRHLRAVGADFKHFLQSAPDTDVEVRRSAAPARPVGLSEQ